METINVSKEMLEEIYLANLRELAFWENQKVEKQIEYYKGKLSVLSLILGK
jgi:hypothetical protein